MRFRGRAALVALALGAATPAVPLLAGNALPGSVVATASSAGPSAGTTDVTGATVKVRLRRAVKRLPVAGEVRRGYDRDRFKHWIDADDDCRDTRDEVLAAESRDQVSGCDVTRGEWLSYYDGETWTDSSDVDIDHVVPLAEAWDSGARRWTARTRTRFANDLGDARALVAVTDDVNQSKSDQDPADWVPDLRRCRYVREWVAVKLRWQLAVDRPEREALRDRVAGCKNPVVRVHLARVVRRQAAQVVGSGGPARSTTVDGCCPTRRGGSASAR
jgi:hypothetical protein